jgi:hypothetical protein
MYGYVCENFHLAWMPYFNYSYIYMVLNWSRDMLFLLFQKGRWRDSEKRKSGCTAIAGRQAIGGCREQPELFVRWHCTTSCHGHHARSPWLKNMPTSPQTHSNSIPPPWIDLPWNNTLLQQIIALKSIFSGATHFGRSNGRNRPRVCLHRGWLQRHDAYIFSHS